MRAVQLNSVRRWISFRLLAAAIWFALAAASNAADDERQLTDLIRSDAGLVLEVRNIRSLRRDVPQSDWFRRVSELSFVKKWQAGPEFARLQAAKNALEVLFRQPLDEVIAETCGDSLLLALIPNGTADPIPVMLSRSDRPDSFERVLKVWNQTEPHEIVSLESKLGTLTRRRKTVNGKPTGPTVFTAQVGRIWAGSPSEAALRDVLSRATKTDSRLTDSLSQSPTYVAGRDALPANCSLQVILNPRAWDQQVRRDHAGEPWLLDAWSRLKSISFGVSLKDGVVCHATAKYDAGSSPAIWQQFLSACRSDRQVAARLPANSLVAAELRLAPQLFGWLRTVDPSEKAQRDWRQFSAVSRGLLGRDLFDEVLPHLRPNLALAIIPRDHMSLESAPVDGLLAMDFESRTPPPSDSSDQPDLVDSLDGALLTLWNLLGLSHNSEHSDRAAILKRRDSMPTQRIRWLSGLSPAEFTYGLTGENLLVASDPKLAPLFWDAKPESTLASEPLFTDLRAKHFADHQQWLFVNARAIRRFLADHADVLQQQLQHWKKLDSATSQKQLGRLQELTRPFDAAFLSAKFTESEIRITAGLVTPEKSDDGTSTSAAR